MPRPLRIDPPDSWHHVMNRGARHQAIFADDGDRLEFLALVGTTAPRFGLEVHAYALLSNHFHLLLRSRRHRLSAGMRHLQHTWTQIVNKRHGWDGPLFRSRFRSQLVDDEHYLHTVLAYIHNNPVRHEIVERAEDSPWTSHRAYIGRTTGPTWLYRDELTALMGGPAGVAEHVRVMADLPDDIGDELVEDLSVMGPLVADTLRRPPDMRPPLEPHEALDRIEALTGASVDRLRKTARGPGANAERRFAVWALRTATELSQSEVGELLHMSTRQVQNIEFDQRHHGWKPPVEGWVHAWMAGEPHDESQ